MLFKMLVGLLVAIYVVFFWKTVKRFYNNSIERSRCFVWLSYHLIRKWDGGVGWLGLVVMMICVVLPAGVVGFCMAPFLWLRFRSLDFLEKKEKERREKVQLDLMEEAERRNNRRAEARKKWLSENKPKLYFNTIDGVTAVLLPKDHEDTIKLTKNKTIDGFWQEGKVLYPNSNTIVFVTKQGHEIINRSLGGDARYKVAGFFSDLFRITKENNVELVRDEGIFVPWINGALMPLYDQRHLILDCHQKGTYESLVEAQAPIDLQPL